jgi:hypothetical protein
VTIPPEVRGKFYALRALALVLMVFAGAIFILRPHDFGPKLLIALAIFASVSIVRYSNASVGGHGVKWPASGRLPRRLSK